MSDNKKKGYLAEKMANDFLLKKGYNILFTNYQTRYGEIDIIAKKDTYICFIEVKYRRNISKGYPRESVNFKKQEKIKNTAILYIAENNLQNVDFRFDVIEILNNNVTHIKNAFQ